MAGVNMLPYQFVDMEFWTQFPTKFNSKRGKESENDDIKQRQQQQRHEGNQQPKDHQQQRQQNQQHHQQQNDQRGPEERQLVAKRANSINLVEAPPKKKVFYF